MPILRYRHVTPNGGMFNCAPEMFTAHMAHLANYGYTALSATEFEKFLNGEPVPNRSVVITFDGGYLDNYVFAFPVLKKFELKANIFLSTSVIKQGEIRASFDSNEIIPFCPSHVECKQRINSGHPESVMMNWDEIRLMLQSGLIDVHSFAHTQTRWDQQLNEEGKNAAIQKEFEQSKSVLISEIGSVSQHFCWPNGYFDDDYLALAKEAGFKYFYTNDPRGFNTPTTSPDYLYRYIPSEKGETAFGLQLYGARHPNKLVRLFRHYKSVEA